MGVGIFYDRYSYLSNISQNRELIVQEKLFD